MKKQLFDILYEKYDFTLPQNMIDQDKQSIFAKYEKNKERYVDLLGKSKAEIQEEFKQLAKRRVKLGLIMADFTRKNDIKVEDGELQKIIQDQAERNNNCATTTVATLSSTGPLKNMTLSFSNLE